MRNSLGPGLRRFAAACPITTAVIVVATILWIASEVWGWWLPKGVEEARGRLGSVTTWMQMLSDVDGNRMVPVPQTNGPYQLWEGEWWRVPISGFHHAGILHLLMNCSTLAFFGWLLERRMGRWLYFSFFLSATAISVLPEYLLEHSAVGLSGAAYALFGALLVLRRRDWQVAEVFTPAIVQFGLVWLIGCVVATQLDIIHIANVAHFVGLAYGWLAGQVMFGRFAARAVARWSFVAAHIVLVPGFYFVMHPFWNGTYQWYLAYHEPQPDRRAKLLEKAVQRDPSLRVAWDQLSEIQWVHGEHEQAWRTVLRGLHHNRSHEAGMQLARLFWQAFVTGKREEMARQIVADIFRNEAAEWQQRLEEVPKDPPPAHHLATAPSKESNGLPEALEKLRRAAPPKGHAKPDIPHSPLPLNPDAPDSAAEGVQL